MLFQIVNQSFFQKSFQIFKNFIIFKANINKSRMRQYKTYFLKIIFNQPLRKNSQLIFFFNTMKQIQNNCPIQGHENKSLSFVCTYKQCSMINRWICTNCLEEKLHDHEFILDKDQFLCFIESKSIQKMLQVLQTNIEIQKISQELDQILQQNYKEIEENPIVIQNQKEIDFVLQLMDKTVNSFFELSNEQINYYINLDNEQIKLLSQYSNQIYEQVKLNHETIKQQLKGVENFSQTRKEIQSLIENQNNEIQNNTQNNIQKKEDYIQSIEPDQEDDPLIIQSVNDKEPNSQNQIMIHGKKKSQLLKRE
ncbi:hypothetical protein pb186bvf_020007 [Paramecium bursaria]